MALVRRLNSLFSRSIGLVVRNTVQYVGSNWKNVSKESKSFSMICTAEGNSRPHCCFRVKKAARAALWVGAYKIALRSLENSYRTCLRTRRQALDLAIFC